MKTVTKETTLYSFAELSPEAQSDACIAYRDGDTWGWGPEWFASLEAVAVEVGAKVERAEFGYRPHATVLRGWDGELDAEDRGHLEELANRAEACSITGFCGDYFAAEAIRDVLDRVPNPEWSDIYRAMGDAWQRDAQDGWEWWQSEECIREDIEANYGDEEVFTADGSLYQ